jgi:hypothetical protein
MYRYAHHLDGYCSHKDDKQTIHQEYPFSFFLSLSHSVVYLFKYDNNNNDLPPLRTFILALEHKKRLCKKNG